MMKESEDMEWEVDVTPPALDGIVQKVNNKSTFGSIGTEFDEDRYWAEIGRIPEPGVKRKNDQEVHIEDEIEGRAPARKLTPLEPDFAKLVVNKDFFFFDELDQDFGRGVDCPDGNTQPRQVLGDARQSGAYVCRRIKTARRQIENHTMPNTNNGNDFFGNSPFEEVKQWSFESGGISPSPKPKLFSVIKNSSASSSFSFSSS